MQSSQSTLDYFKLFKVFQLKKIEKTGLVKIIQDKELNRKIISVEGNISTSNFIAFQTANFPNVPFNERYLYIQAFLDPGKSFCFQVAFTLATKSFKAVYSTLYKNIKKHLENMVHLPLGLPPGKWSLAVVDVYELGLHFGFKAQEMKMIFRVSSIQIRASSKVKGLFQSDHLFSVDRMPKEMVFPLKKEQNYFEKYHYFVESTDPTCLKYATEVKNVISEQKDQAHNVKHSKSKQQKKTVSASKSRKQIEKQQSSEKIHENVNNKSSKVLPGLKKSQHNPPLPPTNTRRKQQKLQQKQLPKQEQIQQIQIERELTPPVPQAMMSLSLSCVQGFSLNIGNLMSVQSYLLKPVYMPVHKPIQLLAACDAHNAKVITGYIDGSFCIWDAIRKSPLGYFLSELSELKVILVDSELSVVLVGLDRMKRQVINIISEGNVVFRQISNYNISGAVLVANFSFQHGIVTFGFQNIRLWRINNEKSIIQGSNIYLGQSNRKVKYTAAVVVPSRDDSLIYVSDSNGFITTISVLQGKMLQSLKIDSCAIDQMLLLADGRCLTSNESGTIKVIDLIRMQVQEEYALSNRIKHMHQLPSEEIILTHFNKSVGSLSLWTSMYSFLMRSHTAAVNGIVYCPLLNRVVSISKDNSIRIWQYVVDNSGAFQFRLQEQYQFVITGEEMVEVACGLQGKIQQVSRVIVGGDSGKLRSINIEKYVIQQQVILQSGPMSLSVSRNGKYVLCTYSSGNSYLLDSNLTIIFKYLHTENQNKKRMKSWKNGFNRINKEFFIENIEEQRLQFYALKDPANPLYCISFTDKKSQISFIGNRVYILTEGQLRLFEKGVMIQMVNMASQKMQKGLQTCIAFQFPLMCVSVGQKLRVKVVTANLQEQQDLPESLNSIKIYYSSEKQEGLLICAGKHSHSLYVFTYQLHNVAESILCEVTADNEQLKQTVNELQISFSNKTTVSGYANKRESSVRNERITKNSRFQQNPKELKSLYHQQEALYEQVKQYLLPKSFQKQQRQEQQNEEEYHQRQQDNVSNELGVLLNYGYQLRQDVEDGIGNFFWLSDNNSLIMLTGGGRRILQHFFSVPIKHKVVSFPSTVTSICLSPRSFQGLRYLAVSVGALVKLYNVDEQISFIRSIDIISSTFLGAVIFQSAITRCNRYLLTLSYNSVNFDGKIYIHLIQLSTGSVVSSSYLPLPPPTNKYKGQQIKQAKQYRMLVNYLKSTLQFVVFNPQGMLYFYRVTSILTLQTLQLEELVPLCRDKLASLTCGCFIGQDEEAVLAIGSENGSLVFIDCRTASILIACIAVLPTPITAISTAKLEQGDKLILFTNSPLLTIFSLEQGLNTFLAAIDPATQSSQGRRSLSVDGEVTARSNASANGQQMVLTKTGSLWLMDYADWVTVKVSSVHTLPISQAEVLSGRQHSYLLSCSQDGTVKLSNLINLEQTLEIYKPRRQARCFSNSGSFLLVAFGEQCYIYDALTAEGLESGQQLSSLGSFRLDAPIVAIKNIPSTQNYFILTQTEVLIVFLSLRQKNKSDISLKSTSQLKGSLFSQLKAPLQTSTANVQINKISDVQSSSELIVNEHAPYDQFAVVNKVGRATVWSRKCLKRSYNPIDELSRVHQLAYYLIDAHAASSPGAGLRFLSQTEYLWTVLQEGAVQVRNFKEHCITRQIKLSVERLTAISCIGDDQLIFYAGDQHGYLCILSENGLLIDRVKAMECPIKSISQWSTGAYKKLLVYGGKYAVTLSVPSK